MPSVAQHPRLRTLFLLAVGPLAFASLVIGMVVGEHARVSTVTELKPLSGLFGLSFMAACMTCLGLFVGSFMLLVPRAARKVGWQLVVVGVAAFIGLQVGYRLCLPIRMRAFQGLAERSGLLIAAIKQYELEQGNPPAELGALVPRYLASVPQTGLNRYPNYTLLTGETAMVFASNRWVLRVDCPNVPGNFDMFLYFPNTNYPLQGYGGSLERLGDWAYVHE